MKIIDLSEEQVEDIERRLSSFDENYIKYKMDGWIQIGVEDNGKLIAGLDACITAFKLLYVSTVFVDEAYRRQGIGARMIREMEKLQSQWASILSGWIPSIGRGKNSTKHWDTNVSDSMIMLKMAIPNTSF